MKIRPLRPKVIKKDKPKQHNINNYFSNIITKTTSTDMDNNFNNLSLVQLILKWKWHIIIITVAAALCGAIFSSSAFITPLYKSEALAYPANISP